MAVSRQWRWARGAQCVCFKALRGPTVLTCVTRPRSPGDAERSPHAAWQAHTITKAVHTRQKRATTRLRCTWATHGPAEAGADQRRAPERIRACSVPPPQTMTTARTRPAHVEGLSGRQLHSPLYHSQQSRRVQGSMARANDAWRRLKRNASSSGECASAWS